MQNLFLFLNQVANEQKHSGHLSKEKLDELNKVLESQKQSVYQELPLVLDSGSYYTIERPYGILLQVLRRIQIDFQTGTSLKCLSSLKKGSNLEN